MKMWYTNNRKCVKIIYGGLLMSNVKRVYVEKKDRI